MTLLLEQQAEMRSHSIVLQYILKHDFWNRLFIRSFVADLIEEELLRTNVVRSKCYKSTPGAKRLTAKHTTLVSYHHNGTILPPLLHNGRSQRPTKRSDYPNYHNNNLLS